MYIVVGYTTYDVSCYLFHVELLIFAFDSAFYISLMLMIKTVYTNRKLQLRMATLQLLNDTRITSSHVQPVPTH
jgi:hypothetical protein